MRAVAAVCLVSFAACSSSTLGTPPDAAGRADASTDSPPGTNPDAAGRADASTDSPPAPLNETEQALVGTWVRDVPANGGLGNVRWYEQFNADRTAVVDATYSGSGCGNGNETVFIFRTWSATAPTTPGGSANLALAVTAPPYLTGTSCQPGSFPVPYTQLATVTGYTFTVQTSGGATGTTLLLGDPVTDESGPPYTKQ